MDLKTLLSTQITEIRNKQAEISTLQTDLTNAQNAEAVLGLAPGSSDKVKGIQSDINTKTAELDSLKRTIQQAIKDNCALHFYEAQLIGPLSTAITSKIADLNTKIENLDLSKLEETLTEISKDANKINQEIHKELVEKRKNELNAKKNKVTDTLRKFEILKAQCAAASTKPDLASLGLSAPAYTPEQEAIAVQLADLQKGLIIDEKKLEELEGKLHQANKKIEADLVSFDKKYNAKGKAAALIAQLEPIAKILGNDYGLENRIKALKNNGDLVGLANACEAAQNHLNANRAAILGDLKRVATEITSKYKFGITNGAAIQTLASNPTTAPEALAAALNTAIEELKTKKIITDAKLHTQLNAKSMANLQANYATLNRANELAEQAILNQAQREQLEKDIYDLQRTGKSKIARQTAKQLPKLNARTHVTKRVQKLKSKYGSFDAFQRSVDLDKLIEAHDVSSLSTLTDETKTKDIQRQAAEAEIAKANGDIKLQRQKERAVYSGQVRRAMSRGDAEAIKTLVQKRQDIIGSLETKLGVKGIKRAMKELRKIDKKIVGRKNAQAIYGDFGKNLRQIHLIGGTALTLPKYLVDLTEELGLDTMAGIRR